MFIIGSSHLHAMPIKMVTNHESCQHVVIPGALSLLGTGRTFRLSWNQTLHHRLIEALSNYLDETVLECQSDVEANEREQQEHLS